MKIRLTVTRRLLREFRAAAVNAFPKETCCFLIGTDTEDKLGPIRYVEINEIWWPDNVAAHARCDRVQFQDQWFIEAAEHAKDAGYVVVGQMHSHPWSRSDVQGCSPDCADSEADQDLFGWNRINGIFLVRQLSDLTKFRTRFRFWGPRVSVEMA